MQEENNNNWMRIVTLHRTPTSEIPEQIWKLNFTKLILLFPGEKNMNIFVTMAYHSNVSSSE